MSSAVPRVPRKGRAEKHSPSGLVRELLYGRGRLPGWSSTGLVRSRPAVGRALEGLVGLPADAAAAGGGACKSAAGGVDLSERAERGWLPPRVDAQGRRRRRGPDGRLVRRLQQTLVMCVYIYIYNMYI